MPPAAGGNSVTNFPESGCPEPVGIDTVGLDEPKGVVVQPSILLTGLSGDGCGSSSIALQGVEIPLEDLGILSLNLVPASFEDQEANGLNVLQTFGASEASLEDGVIL